MRRFNSPARGLLGATASFQRDPTETDPDTLVNAVNNAIDREQTLQSRGEAADSVLDSVSLPAALTVSERESLPQPLPLGTNTRVGITVANAGDEPATAVELTVDASGGVSVDGGPEQLGSIDGGDQVTTELGFAVRSPGTATLEFTASGDNVSQSNATVSVAVVGKGELVDTIVEDLERLRSVLGSLDTRLARPLKKKLDTAERNLDNARRFIGRGRGKQANTQLTAATRVLGAFLNAVEARSGDASSQSSGGNSSGGNGNGSDGTNPGDGNRLPSDTATALDSQATSLIDHLSVAIDARIESS